MQQRTLVLAVLIALLTGPVAPAAADWLSKIIVAGERAATRGATKGAGTLDAVLPHLKAVPLTGRSVSLGASVSQEGHWTFVNRAGERLTAANAEEMARTVKMLAPETVLPDRRLGLLLTEDTVFTHRAALDGLPRGADLGMVVGGEVYPLVRRGEPAAWHAVIRPNVVVALSSRRLFDEAAFQLARPLRKANIRILSLDPAGPKTLAAAPRFDPASKRALSDPIDPDRLPSALSAIRGQTAVVTGRVEGPLLQFQPAAGPVRTLPLADLRRAAEAADVNLVVLKSSTTRQPGARNWLWQRVEVENLDKALERATVSDFFDALGGEGRQLAVQVVEQGAGRVSLTAVPQRGGSGVIGSGIGEALADIVSDLAGKVVTSGIEASLRSSERQSELDQRLVPWLPSAVQFGYLGLALLGLFGLPVAQRWWSRIWPPERRAEYAGPFGYWAARVVKGVAFALVFLPLAAVPAAVWNVLLQLLGWLMLPVRAWRWMIGAGGSAASNKG